METQNPLRLFVGLGNPSKSYFGTRHNIGRDFIGFLEKESGQKFHSSRQAETFRLPNFFGIELPQPLVFARPTCFMNESGGPISGLMAKEKIKPNDLLVIVDDFMIPFGSARIRKQGSSGGHNGLKSIIEHLGTENFTRIRIGVGPVPEQIDPADFVLKKFSASEAKKIPTLYQTLVESIKILLDQGYSQAMNFANKQHF